MMERRMQFFAIVFAALFCSQLTTMSKAQTVFTMNGTGLNGIFKADFNVLMFEKFYSCLCDGSTSSCTVTLGDDDSVIKVEECLGGSSNVQTYSCQALEDIVCVQTGKSATCAPQIVEYKSFCDIVNLEWNQNQQVDVKNLSDGIVISKYGGTFYSIIATYPVSPPQPIQTTRAQIPTATPRITQPSSSTTRQHITTDTIAKDNSDEDKNDNLAIIIGAAVGGAVFVIIVITIIIIIILKRRKQKASSPSTITTTTTTTTTTTVTTNNKDDDTDIYPYGDSSLSNVGPNLTFNNLNSSLNNPTPDTYATVDPNKKLNKKKPSLDTNNVNDKNENKSKDNKNHFRPNAGYTEVDIDLNNDKDRSQSDSGANKGQGVSSSGHVLPPPPPDPSVKPKYYNTFGETGEDPSAAYAQVVKKNKDESAVEGEGAGSNSTRDPSGYEEAVPHTETQYADVDLSAKAKPKLNPSPDGVYSKLHDPERKFTDVYN